MSPAQRLRQTFELIQLARLISEAGRKHLIEHRKP
jgi:hypothetical protein